MTLFEVLVTLALVSTVLVLLSDTMAGYIRGSRALQRDSHLQQLMRSVQETMLSEIKGAVKVQSPAAIGSTASELTFWRVDQSVKGRLTDLVGYNSPSLGFVPRWEPYHYPDTQAPTAQFPPSRRDFLATVNYRLSDRKLVRGVSLALSTSSEPELTVSREVELFEVTRLSEREFEFEFQIANARTRYKTRAYRRLRDPW